MSTEIFSRNSWLFGSNAPYVESLYESWLKNPASVDENWRQCFERLHADDLASGEGARVEPVHSDIVAAYTDLKTRRQPDNDTLNKELVVARKQVGVQQLISSYRFLGSRRADLDPLHRRELPVIPELDPAFYGLTSADLDTRFSAANTYFGESTMTLHSLIRALKETYCGTLAIEYMHVTDPMKKRWWQQKLEGTRAHSHYEAAKRIRILENLTAAEALERHLGTKYVGQKRFSLEGGESLIACMNTVVEKAVDFGIEECVIGMAHRGRLNVLVNTLGKSPKDLFSEFEGNAAVEDLPAGDVKYHNGFSSDLSVNGHYIHLCMESNPSHLEIVDPVVLGSVRARLDQRRDHTGDSVLGVMIHGDAALTGQGIVMETLNLADTRGYGTGGTVHIVVNNQIGFTTSDPRDKGSMTYCTDAAKLIEAPVLHVNGDDPDAVVMATELAMEYRHEFRRDVFIDIVCFRRLGHNEQDTPAVTQPLMYKKIAVHPGTRKLYADQLVAQGVLAADAPEKMLSDARARLREGLPPLPVTLAHVKNRHAVDWSTFEGKPWTDDAATGVPVDVLKAMGEAITVAPEGFALHPLVAKVLNDRRAMARGDAPVDWGMAEHLAFASLLAAHYRVRITGEDSGRGTFSHRHAVLHDQNREQWDKGVYIPLEHVASDQAPFTVVDSVLSENAVLGFEYGYSCASPNALVIWEAQFGDFANGAQVVIDQFISSGEVKWGQLSGLVVMLPHGYEGQGPEHSSARVERFLQLAADLNMQVVQPTNASQLFHLLRRQLVRDFRKPLIVFTPKSLLRSKGAVTTLEELANGRFMPVIGDASIKDPGKVKRIICCSGKVYYDLVKKREEQGKTDEAALVRIEELYPLNRGMLQEEFAKYPNASEFVWCQDEPRNQGPWSYIAPRLAMMIGGRPLGYAGRPESSSPAVGYVRRHAEQQKRLLAEAFGPIDAILPAGDDRNICQFLV